MEPFLPDRLVNEGRYRILREINRGRLAGRLFLSFSSAGGATAVVYEAADTAKGDSRIALKVMNAATGQQTLPLKMVKREVEYASSMRHPNIVRLFDVFAEGNQLVLAWELIDGRDLLDLLNDVGGHMPEDMTAFYLHQILRGVSFMHEKAYCHRDLKPENCMVERRTQNLKIIDFGLSKHLDSVNTLGVGTPDYMAPEMLGMTDAPVPKDGPKYDATAVDVWSLGVTLYLLVTGVYPFENPEHPNSVSHTLTNIKSNSIRLFPPDVSAECQSLIRSLLSPSPKDRPRLKEIAENKWLFKNAKSYSIKIKRPELFVPSLHQRVRFRDRSPSASSKEQESCGLQEGGEGENLSTGCFGGNGVLTRLTATLTRLVGKK